MKEEKLQMFKNRLRKVYRHLSVQAKNRGVSCFRLYDNDLPDFPLCIEVYENHIYLAEYKRKHRMNEEVHERWLSGCVNAVSEILSVSPDDIFVKLRKRKMGHKGQYKREGNRKAEFVVEENGLKFIVNLSDYLDTGLFLDNRVTREWVKKEAQEKNVLNLFSYTGSFSVYAAAGGAGEVTSVDLSRTYLDWAKRNLQLNGFTDPDKYKFIQVDVLQWLGTLPENCFDIIILDPPTFSNSKRMDEVLDIQRDHARLINDCIRILKPGGKIFFSTNYRKFILNRDSINSGYIKDFTRQTTPFDFDGKMNRFCYLVEK